MRRNILAAAIFAFTICALAPVLAQQRAAPERAAPATAAPAATVAARTAPDNDQTLLSARTALSAPASRTRIAALGNLSVQTGDNLTQSVRDIVVESFAEQQTFADRLASPELVRSGALVALPEVDDEVLVFDDVYVVRRSTTIVVKDPARVARESELYRNFIGDRATIAAQPAEALDAQELAGMRAFIANEVGSLGANDPIRAAAAAGEQALLGAIAAGLGELTVEDTLIVPRVAGIARGAEVRLPTVRNGLLDLRNAAPVQSPSIAAIAVAPTAPARQPLAAARLAPQRASPATPEAPQRATEPRTESSGKEEFTAEFLLGVTSAGNFQWERKWIFPSGYFRLTLGAGFAFGYRVPVVADATVEPTYGLIQDTADKRVVIATRSSVRTVNAGSAFYERAGLPASQVQGGDELLLAANVGWGYKFRALWKDLAQQPYTAIGVSLSQGFEPPRAGLPNQWTDFGVELDPKTTKISYDGTFLSGSASLRFLGKTWGSVSVDMETLADGKAQTTTKIVPAAQSKSVNITLDPIPLRQGQTTQTRPFGVRLVNPSYTGRVVLVPGLKFSFGAGYKQFKRTFSTPWINLANLTIDTGATTLPPHPGTPSSSSWNEGEKIFRRIAAPAPGARRLSIGN
jgi:hypothetical protein